MLATSSNNQASWGSPNHHQQLNYLKMLSKISLAALTGFLLSPAAAGPVNGNDHFPASKRSPLGISLPPLIPSIPGVTEPLASNAPPLPILQIPTPPLESPPFTGANIKPKKIGYFWTGAGDNIHKDFLVTASLDDVSNLFVSALRTSVLSNTYNLLRLLGHFRSDHCSHRCAHERKLSSSSGQLSRWEDTYWRRFTVSA